LSALHTGRPLLPRTIITFVSGTYFCLRLSKSQGLVKPEGIIIIIIIIIDSII
jgi:hypothetical protein